VLYKHSITIPFSLFPLSCLWSLQFTARRQKPKQHFFKEQTLDNTILWYFCQLSDRIFMLILGKYISMVTHFLAVDKCDVDNSFLVGGAVCLLFLNVL